MITQIKAVSIPVKDQERAIKFYTEKLGFETVVDADFGEQQRWIEMQLGKDAATRIVLFTPEEHRDRVGTFSHCMLYAEDVEGTYETLGKKGVEFASSLMKESWGTFFMMKDSEGNTFCVSNG